MAILAVENLDIIPFKGMNKTFRNGTISFIAGANNSYKTLLIKVLSGIVKTEEKIRVNRTFVEQITTKQYPYQIQVIFEDENFKEYLFEVLEAMFTCVENGLHTQGILQGSLQLKRVAGSMYQQALNTHHEMAQERLFIASYAYAVSEENADGHMIVTAPTCGASGVLPAILYYAHHQMGLKKRDLVKALAIGGLYGNTVKYNATIAGADGGCQAEVGTACAMASASMAWINELNNSLVDYAAEMGLEHHLRMTCDPVCGLVQIPCIERNAFISQKARECAIYSLFSDGRHKVSFDDVVETMMQTGCDMQAKYRETSLGGLARIYRAPLKKS